MNNGIPNIVKGRGGGVVLVAFNNQDLPLYQGWRTFFEGACPKCPQISKNTHLPMGILKEKMKSCSLWK
jgi:hypothetical protein